jgi:hypothetical protein
MVKWCPLSTLKIPAVLSGWWKMRGMVKDEGRVNEKREKL